MENLSLNRCSYDVFIIRVQCVLLKNVSVLCIFFCLFCIRHRPCLAYLIISSSSAAQLGLLFIQFFSFIFMQRKRNTTQKICAHFLPADSGNTETIIITWLACNAVKTTGRRPGLLLAPTARGGYGGGGDDDDGTTQQNFMAQ